MILWPIRDSADTARQHQLDTRLRIASESMLLHKYHYFPRLQHESLLNCQS